MRSAINHELVIEDMVQNLREKTQTGKTQYFVNYECSPDEVVDDKE